MAADAKEKPKSNGPPRAGAMVWTVNRDIEYENAEPHCPAAPHRVCVAVIDPSGWIEAKSGSRVYYGHWRRDFTATENEISLVYLSRLRDWLDHLTEERTKAQVLLIEALVRFRAARPDDAEAYFRALSLV